MRPETFSLLLELVLLSAVTANHRPCPNAPDYGQAQNPPVIGAYVPQCDDHGNYLPIQCHPSTGYCWCVTPNGDVIAGTDTKPGMPRPQCDHRPCSNGQAQKPPLIGAYVPQCDNNGYYLPMQCHPSTGHCWCVTLNGVVIAGTDTNPGMPHPQCGDKPGKCVVVPTFAPCTVDPNPECKSDGDCKGRQKCCNYACHMKCMDPKADKPGQCKVVPFNMLFKCINPPKPGCRSDWDCKGNQKCCYYACRMQCMDPAGDKPGKCEVVPTFAPCKKDPNPECKSDWNCKGRQKCCNHACHMKCMDPKADKPGQCKVVPFNMLIKCINPLKPGCRSDWDCKGNKKCCYYACHMQCMDPAGG